MKFDNLYDSKPGGGGSFASACTDVLPTDRTTFGGGTGMGAEACVSPK